MPTIWRTRKFDRSLQALAHDRQVRAAKSLQLFSDNPRHPSLHFEKLGGSDCRTIRVDRNHRIVLIEVSEDVYEVIDIGSHDYIYSKFG